MRGPTNPRIPRTICVLIVVCVVGFPVHPWQQRCYAEWTEAETSTYVFDRNQSTLVQTGGIAYVHWTYSIEGQFELIVDPNAGTASFAHVDANATDDSPFKRALDPNHVFNMTTLVGTVLESTTISFTGKADDGSDISITVTLEDDLARLVGETVPPPHSADFFIFNVEAVAQRKYDGGTGEPNDPYLIYTAEHLNAIGAEPNHWDKHFKLMADIDLSAYEGTAFNIIGTRSPLHPFTGVFDGNGKTISNFHYVAADTNDIGLFGCVDDPNAQITHLGLLDPNIEGGTRDRVGSLVGYLVEGTLTGCYAKGGSVSGDDYVGGLVGRNYPGTITDCHVRDCNVSGARYNAGGLVGAGGRLSNCHSTGKVSGLGEVGGLAGTGRHLSNCYSACTVSGSGEVGGLVGYGGHLTCCYASGSVSGRSSVGGLIGTSTREMSNCYATGSVSGTGGYAGGLVGWIYGFSGTVTVSNCYSTGRVVGGEGEFGGLVGGGFGLEAVNSFWDTETSSLSISYGGAGKTTVEMQMRDTFVESGWDFVGETDNGTEDIWKICDGIDYPRLAWEPDCFGCTHEDYLEWVYAGRPACWCYPTQCHGDVDGLAGGSAKTGYYHVGPADLNVLISAWLVEEPPAGPGIASIPNGICADFAHDLHGSGKGGLYRVGPSDLCILVTNWLVKEPPHGPGLPADCSDCQ